MSFEKNLHQTSSNMEITSLPDDVIEIILSRESISIKDTANFTSTCKRFYEVHNNMLWRQKFYQRWPTMKNFYEEMKYRKNIDFKEEIKLNLICRKEMWHFLTKLESNSESKWQEAYHPLSLSDFDGLDALYRPEVGGYPMNYFFIVDELINPPEDSPMKTIKSLELYGIECLLALERSALKQTWNKFERNPKRRQIIEYATSIAEQCSLESPIFVDIIGYESYSSLTESLNNIKQQILDRLKTEYPAHPIFLISPEQFYHWENNNIKSRWNHEEGGQILGAIRKVLFDELRFQTLPPQTRDKKYHPAYYVFINRALKTKRCSTLCMAIIFHCVARRLGVFCDIMNIEKKKLLTWTPKRDKTRSKDESESYINPVNGNLTSSVITKKKFKIDCLQINYNLSWHLMECLTAKRYKNMTFKTIYNK